MSTEKARTQELGGSEGRSRSEDWSDSEQEVGAADMEFENTKHSLERVRPRDAQGHLIMSEHFGRYLWAAQFAEGVEVLDAGCGTGYGAKILAEAGASRVVGVDISESAVKESCDYASGHAEIRQCDLRDLPFRDGEFDLVVCFEVIEHVQHREAILDELKRVVSRNGFLCISTPNSRVYPSGNPYHVHEYSPEQFIDALSARFRHVDVHRQSAYLTSSILSDAEFSNQGLDKPFSGSAVKLNDRKPGEEVFTVALATSQEIPSSESIFVLGDPFEVRWWQQQIQTTKAKTEAEINEAQRQVHQANMEASKAAYKSLNSARRLLEVEETQSLANARIFALEEELEIRADRIHALTERVNRADRVITRMKSSISWRLTAPLRALKSPR